MLLNRISAEGIQMLKCAYSSVPEVPAPPPPPKLKSWNVRLTLSRKQFATVTLHQ